MSTLTYEVTIHRRSDGAPDLPALFDELAGSYLDETAHNGLKLLEWDGATAVVIHWRHGPAPAPWAKAASLLVGPLPHDYESVNCGALLFVEVGDDTYAIGFGAGSRAIPDQFKDHGFGLRFTIRAVDAEEVRGVVRRSMTGLGRQDSTHVPSGIPIGHIGVSEYTELVRGLAGKVDPNDLGLERGRPVRVDGAAGLRLRIPLEPSRLVALLRRISEICAREVQPDFAFVEATMPVRDKRLLASLDRRLDERLRSAGDETAGMRLAPAVPVDLADVVEQGRSFQIKIGPGTPPLRRFVDLDHIVGRCRVQHRVAPVTALRKGEVRIFADDEGRLLLGRSTADRWIEAAVSLDDEYFLVEGAWYKGGAEYFTAVRRRIAALFKDPPCVALPPWPPDLTPPPGSKKRGETLYNELVEDTLGPASFLNLDGKFVPTSFHGLRGFEGCDLLGPGFELIHVKAGKGTSPFSHQFNQALNSTEALWLREDVRQKFAQRVQEASHGTRSLPDGWRPRKVVLAMMADRKTPLTAETLFPHAQIALAHLDRTLSHRYGVELEVVPIERGAS
ncbi:DUF6119 family protein [Actinomadura sp. SCN-SB]|uniref:DUF6119 family protein n=1 Tax=Actinomadura sp. SCN-SB TaxID=3373092 RepID=UPI0037503449